MRISIAMAVACLTILSIDTASAAGAPARKATSIPAQDLDSALRTLEKDRKLQVVFLAEDIKNLRTAGASGELTFDEAMRQILKGTGLTFQFLDENTVSVVPSTSSKIHLTQADTGKTDNSNNQENTQTEASKDASVSKDESADEQSYSEENQSQTDPEQNSDESSSDSSSKGISEILVKGSRSQNVDIRRTEDNIQPYMVIDRSAIEDSGAGNVESLLRQQLPMQTGGFTTSQVDVGSTNSQIDLRGLGTDETLILVDGRRLAQRNLNGSSTQSDINGIPLAAIERVEVLPTTAGGIYGGNATGGAINIVLKREFNGSEVRVSYGNYFDTDAHSVRFDLSGGFSPGMGTRILLGVSYEQSDSLLYEDSNLYARGLRRILDNDPGMIMNLPRPPLGATTNVRSQTGAPLTLKPAFGGGALGTRNTFIPYGYTGPASDAGAGLIANAGQYNFDLANTAQPAGGGRRSLVNRPTLSAFNVTVRREFTDHIEGFFELAGSRNEGSFAASASPSAIQSLPVSAAGNPFNEAIFVTIPLVGADRENASRDEQARALLGATFDLPGSWRGSVDYAWNFSSNEGEVSGGIQSPTTAIRSGAINVFADLNLMPSVFSPFVVGPTAAGPNEATAEILSARFAGPLWFRLPGGRPTMTLLLERRNEEFGDSTIVSNLSGIASTYFARSQTVDAAYGEVLLPLVSEANGLPGMRLFELQLAGREERYNISSSSFSFSPPLAEVPRDKFTSLNPTTGLRWKPVDDLTVRASWGTGFRPPNVGDIVPIGPDLTPASLWPLLGVSGDPVRGGEPLGDVNVSQGGSPNLQPEESEALSIGMIVTPRFLNGLRISVDWSRVDKTAEIANFININGQINFNRSILYAPERFIRDEDPSTFSSFGAGPIRAIDASLINLARREVEAVDFGFDLRRATPWGDVTVSGAATHALTNSSQVVADAPILEVAGLASQPDWRANGSLNWELGSFRFSWFAHYVSSYRVDPLFAAAQGSSQVESQTYHDFGLMFRPERTGRLENTELRLQILNVFNVDPPVDVQNSQSGYYSTWGPVGGINYLFTVRRKF